MTEKLNVSGRVIKLESTANALLAGHFLLEAVKVDGSGSRVLADFKNLVLDQGIDHLLSNTDDAQGFNRFISVGAGTEPESPEQTSLGAKIRHVDTGRGPGGMTQTVHGGSPFRISFAQTGSFGAGAAAGVISEVGAGWNGTSLFSRALVRDVNGEPTSVEVLSDEFLIVTYTLDVYIDVVDKPFTLNFPHGSHDGILRPADIVQSFIYWPFLFRGPIRYRTSQTNATGGCIVSSQNIVGVTSRPTGSVAAPNLTNPPYVPGSFTDSVTLTYPPAVANIGGGIRSLVVRFENWISYQVQFDPPVPKTSDHLFAITLRLTLGRL